MELRFGVGLVGYLINGRVIGISAEVASRVPLLTQIFWMWAVASGGRGYTIPIVATSGNPKVFDEHWWAQFQSWSCLRGFEALYGRVVGVTNCRSEQMESSMDHQEFQRSALESFIPQRFRRRSFGLSIGMFERP